MKKRQLEFDSLPPFKDHVRRTEHGGSLRKGKRKLARPFDSQKCMHITLRSSRARGAWSLLKSGHQRKIEKLIYLYGQKFHVKIFRFANSGNHLHILLRARTRKDLSRYLKSIAGLIPRLVTQTKKGKPIGKFWDDLVYSKIISWGRQFKNASDYVLKNTLEAFGVIPQRANARGHIKIDIKDVYDEWWGNLEVCFD